MAEMRLAWLLPSKALQMFGWFKPEIVFASRSKALAPIGVVPEPRGQHLDGDGAFEPGVAARYTSLMPPTPIADMIS